MWGNVINYQTGMWAVLAMKVWQIKLGWFDIKRASRNPSKPFDVLCVIRRELLLLFTQTI
jgi:hypothetical protein